MFDFFSDYSITQKTSIKIKKKKNKKLAVKDNF